jgi:hypothetical protein
LRIFESVSAMLGIVLRMLVVVCDAGLGRR